MKKLSITAIVLTLVAMSVATATAQFSQGPLGRVSDGLGGITPDGVAGAPIASPNGRYIAFHSTASNLVPGDNNFSRDVFVRDLQVGETYRVSINNLGEEGSGASGVPSISGSNQNGEFGVAFESIAENLDVTLPATNDSTNIFVTVPSLGAITPRGTFLLSRAFDGGLANDNSNSPSIAVVPTRQRVLVAFTSDATNIVENDLNSERDVFLTTLTLAGVEAGNPFQSASTIRISAPPGGAEEADGDSDSPAVSGSGNVVVFVSRANNLTPAGTPSVNQVYLYNVGKGSLSLISRDSLGDPGNGESSTPSVSFNGRYITYLTQSTNIIDGVDTLGRTIVVRYDAKTNTTELVNLGLNSQVADGNAQDAQISPNGRFVVFSDESSNLVEDDNNSLPDIFIKDIETGAFGKTSVAFDGTDPNGTSTRGSLAADGFNSLTGAVAFLSNASNITDTGGGIASVYTAEGEIAPPPFREDTELEVPPDIRVVKRRAFLGFQKFTIVPPAPAISLQEVSSGAGADVGAMTEGDKIRYQFRVRGPGGIRIDNRQKLAKRNRVSVRNLRPGQYTARYRVVTVRGSQNTRVGSSPLSPPQRFQVRRRG